jgi:hypothetical protein
LPESDAHSACEQQRVHLRLAAKDTSRDGKGQFDDLALDREQVAIALLSEVRNDLGALTHLKRFSGSLCGGMGFAFGLLTLLPATLAPGLKRPPHLVGKALFELGPGLRVVLWTRAHRVLIAWITGEIGLTPSLPAGSGIRLRAGRIRKGLNALGPVCFQRCAHTDCQVPSCRVLPPRKASPVAPQAFCGLVSERSAIVPA